MIDSATNRIETALKPIVCAPTASYSASADSIDGNCYRSMRQFEVMKTVFLGTPTYAIASIRALRRAGIEVSLVCTRPARRVGRGKVSTDTPVAQYAKNAEIPVITPNRFDSATIDAIRSVDADALVVVAYGRFIPKELLGASRLGAVNIHPSLLPRHRGPSPVVTAILEGDAFTGVTLMLLDEGMDTGPIVWQSSPVAITPETRCAELTERLFELGAEMLPEVLSNLDAGVLKPKPQGDEEATVTELIRKQDGVVDWDALADHIVRMNRAYDPWPGTNTLWNGQLLKLIDVDSVANADIPSGIEPGMVYKDDEGGVFVCAGESSAVRLLEVQMAGRRAMDVGKFIAGRPDFVGSCLGA